MGKDEYLHNIRTISENHCDNDYIMVVEFKMHHSSDTHACLSLLVVCMQVVLKMNNGVQGRQSVINAT